ncbi:hypothetical protein Cfla_0453 [Cellulomonas flavigena DSM 20109]|uniref:DUF6234 domain-containing protein n=1 Tax=Cellulomonas flavigena (strain ATCC 482 / DSM 20109 / BCRC 11376 / JCM 18109 / NBRC 3775 / NCIMB 8073 / NRS 134) TaxID=446466 RepID=D5UHU4_CELFN|nr:DUF6234 family protein [Cellulomonas flavigena]ADG73368.1 hypothetical protein Cfla_0453 [Cellulomonas flavigena DSM 20109]
MTDTLNGESSPSLERPPGATRLQRRGRVPRLVAGLCLTVGSLLAVLLFFQYLATYFVFFGDVEVATPDQATRYVVTATACLTLLLAGTAAAIARGRLGLSVLALVLTLAGVVVVALFPVPNDRWEREPEPRPANLGPVCYSGSDCSEGGG